MSGKLSAWDHTHTHIYIYIREKNKSVYQEVGKLYRSKYEKQEVWLSFRPLD
jgi:hypothetical protein